MTLCDNSDTRELLAGTIFLGGPTARISVRMRCVQVAVGLGCDYLTDVTSLDTLPRRKTLFVCVKPQLSADDLRALARRGRVVWDIHDVAPPTEGIAEYLVSSQSMRTVFTHLGRITVIPHHHCNANGEPNRADLPRTPAWVGRPHWCPTFEGLPATVYNSNVLTEAEVVSAYRSMGLCINIRRECEDSAYHARINGGGKLINCIGFGIPSVSGDEPAYHEVGTGCTLFGDMSTLADQIRLLQTDHRLYMGLRERAWVRGREFHIAKILGMYTSFMHRLSREARADI